VADEALSMFNALKKGGGIKKAAAKVLSLPTVSALLVVCFYSPPLQPGADVASDALAMFAALQKKPAKKAAAPPPAEEPKKEEEKEPTAASDAPPAST
jgi:hypothetical protein